RGSRSPGAELEAPAPEMGRSARLPRPQGRSRQASRHREIAAVSEDGKPQGHAHAPPPDAGWALSAAGREVAETYLREQTRLARLQADDIVREDAIRHWSLRFSHATTVLKLAFELALALIFLIVAGIVIQTVWSARNASGLV